MSTVLGAGILAPALRIAGISLRPGRTPSTDQSNEAIAVLNRMLGSWDIDPLDIFTYTITLYPLTANQISYQFGAGAADFPAAAAPVAIPLANIVLPGTPPFRYELDVTDKAGWAAINLQAIPGGITKVIYPDFGFPITTIYVYPQPSAGYQLEIYTPAVLNVFVTTSDTVTLPLGYERAIVYNLAVELAATYPRESALMAAAPQIAADSKASVESRNARTPRLKNDAAGLQATTRNGDGLNWWRTGGYGQ